MFPVHHSGDRAARTYWCEVRLTLHLQDAQGQETTVDIDIAGEKVETHVQFFSTTILEHEMYNAIWIADYC